MGKRERIGTWVRINPDKEEQLFNDEEFCTLLEFECLKKLNRTHKDIDYVITVKKRCDEIGGPLGEYCTYGIKAYGYRRYNIYYLSYKIKKLKDKIKDYFHKLYMNYNPRG